MIFILAVLFATITVTALVYKIIEDLLWKNVDGGYIMVQYLI